MHIVLYLNLIEGAQFSFLVVTLVPSALLSLGTQLRCRPPH